MADRTYLGWPFFDDAHRELAAAAAAWRDRDLDEHHDADPAKACRAYVSQLGAAGWLKYAVPRASAARFGSFDVRSICLLRETFGYASGLAEFAFAMQGLVRVRSRCSVPRR
jgi:acyl-CoA dehydrogenase